jgi:acyl carrier protein
MFTTPRRPATAGADDTLGRLREIVTATAELDPAEVTLDAHLYDDLLVDSLQKLEIVVRLERAFGVKLSDHEAAELHTLRDAVELLRARDKLGHD